jgi:hypothetical protein
MRCSKKRTAHDTVKFRRLKDLENRGGSRLWCDLDRGARVGGESLPASCDKTGARECFLGAHAALYRSALHRLVQRRQRNA